MASAQVIEPIQGLSEGEVRDRQARGMVNRAPAIATRTYVAIMRANVFTFINNCLFALGIFLLLLGRPFEALISAGVVLINAVASSAQELRAKQQLDRIALLYRPTAVVVRGGHDQTIQPEEIVLGDVIKVAAGDQILVDGSVIGSGRIEVDESQLTGESDVIPKLAGDKVFSGSSCVNGHALYVAEEIGAASLISQITAKARAFRRVLTPMQRDVNTLVRVFLLTILYLEVVVFLNAVMQRTGVVLAVQEASVIAGLIPNGLFLTISVAYAISAVRLLRFGVLVQQSNAVESLSYVDTLCVDKTGTLTANRLQMHSVYPIERSAAELEDVLGIMVASASTSNKTSEAIARAYPREEQPPVAQVPFSSARKWSAVAFDTPAVSGIFALGAIEFLEASVQTMPEQWHAIQAHAAGWTAEGLRVLLVVHHPNATLLEDRGDDSRLPMGMEPLGLISLSDELRPEARETLRAFLDAGVQPKIISGDHPETVAALARQAGLPHDIALVSGPELAEMEESEIAEAAETATIFGRITPQQKEYLVRVLRERGRYVAMIGDGVNDVLSLKQAQLGIAMQSGSQATRNVADIVLSGDSFAALVPAVREGQKIVNGMQDILALFLTGVGRMALIIVSALVISSQFFPITLVQAALVAFLTTGIPTPLIALWARSGAPATRGVVRQLLRFMLPAMVLSSFVGVLVFFGTLATAMGTLVPPIASGDQLVELAVREAQTALTTFLVLSGLILVVFAEPPTAWWAGADQLAGDWRPTLSVLVALVIYVVILAVPQLRTLATLTLMGPSTIALILVGTLVWTLALRWVWRSNALERFLTVDFGHRATAPTGS